MSPERKGKTHSTRFEEIARLAKEVTLRDGYHGTLFILDGSKDIVAASLSVLPDTHDARVRLMQTAGGSIAKSGKVGQLRQVFLISEGWMSMANEDKPPNMQPSHDPNRKEVLIISGLQIEERLKYLKMFEMQRNQEGKLISLDELLPTEEKNGNIKILLLEAFARGFQGAFNEQAN